MFKEIVADISELGKRSIVTSMGFIVLIVGELLIALITPTHIFERVFWIFMGLWFFPSMLVREYYKKQDEIKEETLNKILQKLHKIDQDYSQLSDEISQILDYIKE